jgi:predicted RNase H-like nuclease
VAVELADGKYADAHLAPDLTQLLAARPGLAAVAVDMPVGLLDEGWRAADVEARALLVSRRSTVFLVPPRAVWEARDLGEANRVCRARTGSGLSAQTWALKSKLIQANEHPGLREAHPEVSFHAMAEVPVLSRKTTWTGQMRRRDLLREHGIDLPDQLHSGAGVGDPGQAQPDDVLDAAAVAWTADRIARGVARSLPDPPQVNERGEQLAIWY